MKIKPDRISTLILIMTIAVIRVNSQTDNTFTPNGKPIVLMFSNVNATFNKNGNSKSFELTRAYLGYEYYFSKTFSSRVTFDIANPGTGKLQMTAIVKNAYVQYKSNGLTARLGMFGSDQFNIQEKQWGYRYIYKSFQDEHNFGPSADLGAALEYTPLDYLTIDMSVMNGEGNKKLQSDSTFKTSVGLTLRPFSDFVLRGYFDRMKNDVTQTSYVFYVGYTLKKFKAGVEYNFQENNGMINGNDFSGISAYTSLQAAAKVSVFARYDYLWSERKTTETNPWNFNNDGRLYILGFDYAPVTGVKVAPNFLGWAPADKSEGFSARVGLNVEVKF